MTAEERRAEYPVRIAASSRHLLPTPNTDSLCGGSGSYAQIKNDPNLSEDEKRSMASGNAGRLNLDWVEWLMCWPVGWTDVETPNHRLSWRHPGRDPADLPPDDSAYVPRLTMRRDNHAKRIRAIGNGQFPATAHVAFKWGLAVLEAVRAGG